MSDKDADAVLKELGAAAEGNEADGQSQGGEGEGEGAAKQPEKPATEDKQADARKSRAQKAAETRERKKREREQAEAMEAKAEADAGVTAPGVSDANLDRIPTDADGNPLWYYNRKTKRAVRANRVLNRSDIREKMKLIPCMPPKGAAAIQ